jgi:hypothetical protein
LAQGRDVVRDAGDSQSVDVRPNEMVRRERGEDMSNSKLLWPTPKQLRRRYELMDRMMHKRGADIMGRAAWMVG